MHSGIQCSIVLDKLTPIDLAQCYDLARRTNLLLDYLGQIVRSEDKSYLGDDGFVILQLSDKRPNIMEGGNFYLQLIAVNRNEKNTQHIYHEILRNFYYHREKISTRNVNFTIFIRNVFTKVFQDIDAHTREIKYSIDRTNKYFDLLPNKQRQEFRRALLYSHLNRDYYNKIRNKFSELQKSYRVNNVNKLGNLNIVPKKFGQTVQKQIEHNHSAVETTLQELCLKELGK